MGIISGNKRSLLRTVIALAIFGYLQSAIFYWRWRIIPHEIGLVCPFCPHLDSAGSNWEKFVGRMFVFGTINSVVLIAGFLVSYGIYWVFQKTKFRN